jgi:APA family basic amino acid/polyamine antiporter
MLRVLGSAFGLAMVVGAMIGAGILGEPGSVAAALPSTGLFIGAWLFGAFNACLGATAYAELGTMMPMSGGAYVFAHRALGETIGFFTGYADWINWCVGTAAMVLLAGVYLGDLLPFVGTHVVWAGVAACGALVLIQLAGVRSTGRVQEVTTALKTIALVALIIATFVLPHPKPAAAATSIVPHGGSLILAFAIAMQGVIFSYDAYYAVVYCGEEMVDPGRTIPRSIFRGLLLVTVIYLGLNIAFLRIVPVAAMAHDAFVGGTVARLVLGPIGDTLIRLTMVVAILGTANAQIIAAPRVLLAMARDGLFPAQAARVDARGTPTVALAMSVAIIGAFLLVGTFDTVIALDAFFIIVIYLIVFTSLFVLRRREPDAERPYRATGYPYVPGLAIVLAILLLVAMAAGDHRGALITGAVFLICWPASHLVRRLLGARQPVT